MPTAEELKIYLLQGIASFGGDPADNDYQRGYLAALNVVLEDNFMTREERVQHRRCADSAAQIRAGTSRSVEQ